MLVLYWSRSPWLVAFISLQWSEVFTLYLPATSATYVLVLSLHGSKSPRCEVKIALPKYSALIIDRTVSTCSTRVTKVQLIFSPPSSTSSSSTMSINIIFNPIVFQKDITLVKPCKSPQFHDFVARRTAEEKSCISAFLA